MQNLMLLAILALSYRHTDRVHLLVTGSYVSSVPESKAALSEQTIHGELASAAVAPTRLIVSHYQRQCDDLCAAVAFFLLS